MIPLLCFQTNCSDSSMTASFLFFYWILSSWPLPMPSSLHLFFFFKSQWLHKLVYFLITCVNLVTVAWPCSISDGGSGIFTEWFPRSPWVLTWAGRQGKQEHGGPCRKFLWARPRSDLYHFPSHFISSGPKNRTKQNMSYNTKSKSFLPCFHFPHSCFYCQSPWARVATLPAVYSLSSPLWSCSLLLSPSWKWWVAHRL